jgi:tripartite-type tricarboxylate transporter receptor subunit TctC
VPQFIAYAKANSGKLNMASAGIGGPQHIAGELFKFMAGVDLTHIPYKGSTPAVTDLVAGQVSRPRCRRSRQENSGRWA